MQKLTDLDRKQKLFDKAYEVFEQGKDTSSFWAWITRELNKFPLSKEEALTAFRSTTLRHQNSPIAFGRCRDAEFDNVISDEEIQRLLDLVEV